MKGEVPGEEEEEREEEEGRAKEGDVEKDKEELGDLEEALEDEEAERLFPPPENVELEESGFEEGEIASIGEQLSQVEGGCVVGGREAKTASVDLHFSHLASA